MKRNKIMFVIAIVAILAVLFVACDEGTQPEHTHTYGAWSITTQPTETATGTATRACACGDVQTTTVAKLSDASVWTVTVNQDATHETAGFKAYKSADFGTITVTVPKGEHAYGAWEISKEPTETETGIARRYCACGHYDEAVLAVLTNATVWTKTTQGATHQTPGKEIYTSEYGVVTIVTDAIQHVYGEWTSNNDDTHSRVCACGDRQTENCVYDQQVAAPAYLKTAATCTSKAVYYKSCVCGAKSNDTFESGSALGHDYTNFQVKSEPTCTEDGQVTADCTRCDQKYDGAIPAFGHDFTGECVPYVDDISYGDDYEGGTSYDGSEYHVHQCTRCDAVDTAHKEKHTFGEAVYSLSLVQGTTDMYNVDADYTCTACDYTNHVTDEFNRYIGQDDAWTKGEEVAADYNQAGYVEYTFKSTGKTIRIAYPKLVAPYEGTTYYAIQVKASETDSSAVVTSYKTYKDTYFEVTFDANGKATGEAFPFKGENTVCITDATTGALTYTRVDGSSTYNDTGCIDLENGVIAHTNNGVYSDFIVMFPTSMTVTTNDVSGSHWTDSLAFSYSAICNLNETHTFNVFVYNEKVYFGVQYVDMDGKAVAAGACSEAPYVKVLDAEGNKIQAFAQKNGSLRVTDGKEGTYTSADNTIKFDGVGGFVVDGKSGFYTVAAEGASYGYDAYVGADVATATEYYQITLGENNTCTVVKPVATLRFRGDGVEGIENVTANINIVTTLPTPVRAGYVFNGWKLDGEGESVATFKATEAGNEYVFEAQWTKQAVVTVKDLKDEDKAQYSIVYVGVGNPFVTALPAYTENTYRDGYKFEGWYLDNGDGVIDEDDTPLDDNYAAENENVEYVVIASWTWAGNVEFNTASDSTKQFVYDAAKGYWKSTNQGVNNSTAYIEIYVTEGTVDISFTYWRSSEGSDKMQIQHQDVNHKWATDFVSSGTTTPETQFSCKLTYNAETKGYVRIEYKKDGSVHSGEDTAYFKDLRINGVLVAGPNALGKNAGTYTATDSDDIKVSAGGVVTINDNDYAYTTVSENVIGVMVGDVYKEYTLNKATMTYTVVEPKVTVAYNYSGHGGTNTSAQVGKYSTQTLSTDVLTADGFVFRGWYTNEACTTKASATFVASADITFYAKWDAAITLTYNYLNEGANADAVVNLYANDKVETVLAVDFKYGDKVFVGWFTKDGSTSGIWGDEFVANTTLTANTTVYAKWVIPHALMGEYLYYANIDPAESGIVGKSNSLSYNTSNSFKVDANGNVTGAVSGAIKDYDPTTGTFYVLTSNNSKIYGGYNADTKVIYTEWSAQSSAYHDIKFAAANIGEEVPTVAYTTAWDKGITKLVRITYKKTVDGQEVLSYRYVFIKDRAISTVTSWSAKDAKSVAVTDFEKIYSDANLLTIVCGETTIELGKKNSNFTELDGYQGTYTTVDGTITLDGVGGVTLADNTVGTYTKAADDAGYTFDVKTADKAYKLTVDKDALTWQIAENALTVSYVNTLKEIESSTAYVGIQFTLPSGKDVEVTGYTFRGWYAKEDFSGSVVTKVTLTEKATYYAKYDIAVSLTFDYSGYEYETGKTTQDVEGKYANDTVGTLPTIASDARYEGKAFAGWFYKDGENWGSQATKDDTLKADTTIYAKWIEPAASEGIYKGVEIWNAKSGSEKANSALSTVLTINADGSYSGNRDIAGKLSADDASKMNGAINVTRYAYLSNALGGIVIFGYYDNATSVGTDFYIGFANYANITKVEYSADTIGSGYVAFFTVSYTEDGTAKTMNLVVINNEIIANVTFTDGVTAKAAATTDEVLISDATGKAITKKSGSTMLNNDGKNGSYTGTEFGEVILDGYGTITVNEQNVAYTLNEDKTQATFVLNNQMRVIALGNGTYTLALDGYQGSYTLPDDSTIALDGHGVVTGTSKTYVVSGTNITIYDGETSTVYGLDGKNLLGKSKFAGLTYRYSTKAYDYIKFDDGIDISGELGMGSSGWYTKFNGGVINGNELTVTVVSCNCNGISVGQTIVFTIDGDTLTIKSGKFNSNAVDVAVGYSYTLEK